ncbi:MAG TPA: SIMPL domain-containing protein [Gemmatimonadales bacterium]|nr:SIMPL domain-containing protein [Gemmatimonadales bacterium]
MRTTVKQLLAAGLLVAVAPAVATSQHLPLGVIVVTGEAEQQVPADSAVLRITWYLKNGEPAAQRAEDAVALDSLRALLRRAGIADPLLRAARNDWYGYLPDRSPELARERRRQAAVHVTGEQNIVQVLGALRNNAIFREVEPEYACTCADSAQAEMLKEAFEVSRRRALALAAAAGARLTGLSTIATHPFNFAMSSGYQGSGLEHAGGVGERRFISLLRPPPPGDDAQLAAPLVSMHAEVYVVWQIEHR